MQKFPYVFPIVGGRKIEHLHANIEALDIALTPEQIKFLDDIVPFDKGFPYNMFVSSIYPVIFAFAENRCREMVPTTLSSTSLLAISTNGLLPRLFAQRSSRCSLEIPGLVPLVSTLSMRIKSSFVHDCVVRSQT